MQSFKQLKRNAKTTVRHNYWKIVIVCFFVALAAGLYSSAISLGDFTASDETERQDEAVENVKNSLILSLDGFIDGIDSVKAISPALKNVAQFAVEHTFDSDSAILNIARSLIMFASENTVIIGIGLLVGFILKIVYDIFISSSLRVGEKRFFLESRRYRKTRVRRIFFVFRQRSVPRVAWVMTKKEIFSFLWWLTVVGGVIKHYEYSMIPYILAENPSVTAKDAFALSKQMMKGQKMRAFLLDLSFLGWRILGILTFGILNVFFVNSYYAGTKTEYYMDLRTSAISSQNPKAALFVDVNLAVPVAAEAPYPIDSYPLDKGARAKADRKPMHPERRYTPDIMILLFFSAAFVGWIWEVCLTFAEKGIIVNRGTMYGPWLPIYGTGAMVALIFLRRWLKKPILTFFIICGVCSVVEYAASFILEKLYNEKWWDYSDMFLNLNGRICFIGILIFGIAGSLFVYYIAPSLDNLYSHVPKTARYVVCGILVACFAVDCFFSFRNPNSGEGINQYYSLVPFLQVL